MSLKFVPLPRDTLGIQVTLFSGLLTLYLRFVENLPINFNKVKKKISPMEKLE